MIQIIFENENFVICDKPCQVLSTPDRHASDRPCLGLELQKKLNQQIYPVHRLDFEVSGLIMYAKNKRAHQVSQSWFMDKVVTKKYQALTSTQDFSHWPENIQTVRGVLSLQPGQTFFWKTQIQRGKRRCFESTHGEWAETKAEVVTLNDGRISWNLYPLTGKPHQLRLELSRRGFPILGDKLYGSQFQITQTVWRHGSMALRSIEIDFTAIQERLGLPEKIVLQN